MKAPRGDAEQTKAQILTAARRLFAAHGISAVSVREIAREAGVTHGLVHHYFGTKEQLEGEVIRSAAASSAAFLLANPIDSSLDSLTVMRRVLRYFLTDGRDSALIVARAQLTGFEPEKIGLPETGSTLRIVAERFAEIQKELDPVGPHVDPLSISIGIGAALFGFITMRPWLAMALGLDPQELDDRLDEMVDMGTMFVGMTLGIIPAGNSLFATGMGMRSLPARIR